MLCPYWACTNPAQYRLSGALLAGGMMGFKVDGVH